MFLLIYGAADAQFKGITSAVYANLCCRVTFARRICQAFWILFCHRKMPQVMSWSLGFSLMCACASSRRFRRADCRLSFPKVPRFRSPRIAAGKLETEQQFLLVGIQQVVLSYVYYWLAHVDFCLQRTSMAPVPSVLEYSNILA